MSTLLTQLSQERRLFFITRGYNELMNLPVVAAAAVATAGALVAAASTVLVAEWDNRVCDLYR